MSDGDNMPQIEQKKEKEGLPKNGEEPVKGQGTDKSPGSSAGGNTDDSSDLFFDDFYETSITQIKAKPKSEAETKDKDTSTEQKKEGALGNKADNSDQPLKDLEAIPGLRRDVAAGTSQRPFVPLPMGWRGLLAVEVIGQIPGAPIPQLVDDEITNLIGTRGVSFSNAAGQRKTYNATELRQIEKDLASGRLNADRERIDKERALAMAIYKNLHGGEKRIEHLATFRNNFVDGLPEWNGAEVSRVRFKIDNGIGSTLTSSAFLSGAAGEKYIQRYLWARTQLLALNDPTSFPEIANRTLENNLHQYDPPRPGVPAPGTRAGDPPPGAGGDRMARAGRPAENPVVPPLPFPADYPGLATFLKENDGLADIGPLQDRIVVSLLTGARNNGDAQLGNRAEFLKVLEREGDKIKAFRAADGVTVIDVGAKGTRVANDTIRLLIDNVSKEPNYIVYLNNVMRNIQEAANRTRPADQQVHFADLGKEFFDSTRRVEKETPDTIAAHLDPNKPEEQIREFLAARIPTLTDATMLNSTDAKVKAPFRALLHKEIEDLKTALDSLPAIAPAPGAPPSARDRAKAACNAVKTDYPVGDKRTPAQFRDNLLDVSGKTYDELAYNIADPKMTPNVAEAERQINEFIAAKASISVAAIDGLFDTKDSAKKADYKTILDGEVNRIRTALTPVTVATNGVKAAALAACDAAAMYSPTIISPTPREDLLRIAGGTPRTPVPEPTFGQAAWTTAQWVLPNITPWNNWWSIPKDLVWANIIRSGVEAYRHQKPDSVSRARVFFGTLEKNFTPAELQARWYANAANQAARNTPIDRNTGVPVGMGHPGLDPTNENHFARVIEVYQNELARRTNRNRIGGRAMNQINPAEPNPNRPSVFDRLPRVLVEDIDARLLITDVHGGPPGLASEIAENPKFTGRTTNAEFLAFAQTVHNNEKALHIPDQRRLRALELYVADLQTRAAGDKDGLALWHLHTDRGNLPITPAGARALLRSGHLHVGIAETMQNRPDFTGRTTNEQYQAMIDQAYNDELRLHDPDIRRAEALRLYSLEIGKRQADALAIYEVHTDIGRPKVQDGAARGLVYDATIRGGAPPGIAETIANSPEFNGRTTNAEYLRLVKRFQDIEINGNPPDAERVKAFELYVKELEQRTPGLPALQVVHLDRGLPQISDAAARALIRDAGHGVPPGIAEAILNSPSFTGTTTNAQYLAMLQQARDTELSGHPDPTRARAYDLYVEEVSKRAPGAPALFEVHNDRGRPGIQDANARTHIAGISGTINVDANTTNGQYLASVLRAQQNELTARPLNLERIRAFELYVRDISSRAAGEPCLNNVVMDRGLLGARDATARVMIPTISNAIDIDGKTTNSQYAELVRRAQGVALGGSANANLARAYELHLEDIGRRSAGQPAIYDVSQDRGNPAVQDGAARALIADNGHVIGIASTIATSPEFNGRTTNGEYLRLVKRAQEVELTTRPPNPERIRAFELHVKDIEGRPQGDPALFQVSIDRGRASITDIDARAEIPHIAGAIAINGRTTNLQYLQAVRRAESNELSGAIDPLRARAYQIYTQDIAGRPQGEPALLSVITDRGLAGVNDPTARALIGGISRAIDIDGRTTNAQYLEELRRAQEVEATGAADPTRLRALEIHIQEVSRRPADQAAFPSVSIDRGIARVNDTAARALIPGSGGIADTVSRSANFNGATTNSQYTRMVRTAYESELSNVPPNPQRLRAFELYLNDLTARATGPAAGQPAFYDVTIDRGAPAVQDGAARALIADNGGTPGIASTIANSPEFNGRTTNGEYLRLVRRAHEAELSARPLNPERIRAFELHIKDIQGRPAGDPALSPVSIDRGMPSVQDNAARAEIASIASPINIDGRTTNAQYLQLVRRAEGNELSGHIDPVRARAYQLYLQDLAGRPAGDTALLNVVTDRGQAGVQDADARALITGISNSIDIDGKTTNAEYLKSLKHARDAEAASLTSDPIRLRALDLYIQDVSSRTADKPALYSVSHDRGQARVQDIDARGLISGTGGIADTIASLPSFTGNTTNGQYLKLVRTAYESELSNVPPNPQRLRAFELYIQDLTARATGPAAGQPALYDVTIDRGASAIQDGPARALIADSGKTAGIASTIANSPEFNGRTTNGAYATLVRRTYEAELDARPLNPERIRALELYLKDIERRPQSESALSQVSIDRGMPSVKDDAARGLIPDIAKAISIDGTTTNKTYLELVKRAESNELSGHADPVKVRAFQLYLQELAGRPAGETALLNVVTDRGEASVKDADARALITGISNSIDIDGKTTNAEYLKLVKQARDAEASGAADPTRLRALDLYIQDVSARPADRPAVYSISLDRGQTRVQDSAARVLITGTGGIADTIYSSPNFNGTTTNGKYHELVRKAYESELSNVPPTPQRLRAFELYMQDLSSRTASESALRWVNSDAGRAAPTIDQTTAARNSIAKTDLGATLKSNALIDNKAYLEQLKKIQERERIASNPNEARIAAADALVAKWTGIASTDATGFAYIEHSREAGAKIPNPGVVEHVKDQVLKHLKTNADKNPDSYTNRNCLEELRRMRIEAISNNDLGKAMACNALISGDGVILGWDAVCRAAANADKPAQAELYRTTGEEVPDSRLDAKALERAIARVQELASKEIKPGDSWKKVADEVEKLNRIKTPDGIESKAWTEAIKLQSERAKSNQSAITEYANRNRSNYEKAAKETRIGMPHETFATTHDALVREAQARAERHQKLFWDVEVKYLREGSSLGVPMHSEKYGWKALAEQSGLDYQALQASNGDPEYMEALKAFHEYCASPDRAHDKSPAVVFTKLWDRSGDARDALINSVYKDLRTQPGAPLTSPGEDAFKIVREHMQNKIKAMPETNEEERLIKGELEKFCNESLVYQPGKKPQECIDDFHHGTYEYQLRVQTPDPVQLKVQEFIWQNKIDRTDPHSGADAPDLATRDVDPMHRGEVVAYFRGIADELNDPAEAALKAQYEDIAQGVNRAQGSLHDYLAEQAGLSTDPKTDSRNRDIVLHALLESDPHARVSYTGEGIKRNGVPQTPAEVLTLLEKELEREASLNTDPDRETKLEQDLKQIRDWKSDLTSKNDGKRRAAEAQYNDYVKARFENDMRSIRDLEGRDPSNKHGGRVTAFLILGRFLTGQLLRLL